MLKDVPGFEERFAVTSDGRVWRHPIGCSGALAGRSQKPGRWLKQWQNHGYLYVAGGDRRQLAVHRLVALAYLPRDAERTHVNHKNGNKQDNRVENLEWVSQRENNAHAVATGLAAKWAKVPPELVGAIRAAADDGLSAAHLAKRFGVPRTTVQRIVGRVGAYRARSARIATAIKEG
jgi:hypothetical protein